MEQDLKWIKKHYGEKMMHLCRKLFPVILEKEGLLPEILKEHFHPNKELARDILDNDAIVNFKAYIYSIFNEEIVEFSSNKSVAELLDEAGYILFPECQTEEEIQAFKKYYRPDEELCTFRGGRLNTCRVWFAIKKNVDEIKRENFTNPKRQDEYGTSVISIQFTRHGSYLSIKNRYNHTVINPDSTFNNNLDNIIEGLSDAFEKEFGVSDNRNTKNNFELQNYVRVNNKFYKYNYEINNIYYCPNNIIIDNFNVKKLPDSQMLVDYFIFDFKEKKIYCYDTIINESFADSIEKIDKMEYRDNNITIYAEGYEPIVIGIENGRIKSLYNPNLKECGDYFLEYNETLTSLELPNLERCGDDFLCFNELLTSLSLPKLERCGNNFLYYNETLTSLSLPKLERCGDYFLSSNKSLTSLELPKLERCGDYFLSSNKSLTSISLTSLEYFGEGFLENSRKLAKTSLTQFQEEDDEYDF